jgi:hypothetical protein
MPLIVDCGKEVGVGSRTGAYRPLASELPHPVHNAKKILDARLGLVAVSLAPMPVDGLQHRE